MKHYESTPPKGEFVLVIEGNTDTPQSAQDLTFESAVELAAGLVKDGLRTADAAKKAAAVSGFSKSEIYKALIKNGQ